MVRETEKENDISIVSRLTSLAGANVSNPLTGTTEARQAEMDTLCRELHLVQDLNSIRAQVNEEQSFKDVFKGWNSELKPVSEYSPDNGGKFRWATDKPANPVIIDGSRNILQEDRISLTFEHEGQLVDWHQPNHYRSSAKQYSMVLGYTPNNECVAIQGQWQGSFGNRLSTWWAFTALLVPKGDGEEWFDEVVRLHYGVSSYEEYSEAVEEERAERERAYTAKTERGNMRGAHIASSI